MLIFPIFRAVLDLNVPASPLGGALGQGGTGVFISAEDAQAYRDLSTVVRIEMVSGGQVVPIAAGTSNEVAALFDALSLALRETERLTEQSNQRNGSAHPLNRSHLDDEPVGGAAPSDLEECARQAQVHAQLNAQFGAEASDVFHKVFGASDGVAALFDRMQSDPALMKAIDSLGNNLIMNGGDVVKLALDKAGKQTCSECKGSGILKREANAGNAPALQVTCGTCAGTGLLDVVSAAPTTDAASIPPVNTDGAPPVDGTAS